MKFPKIETIALPEPDFEFVATWVVVVVNIALLIEIAGYLRGLV